MERISRALDLARAQRDQRQSMLSSDPHADGLPQQLAVQKTERNVYEPKGGANQPELGDTLVFKLPVIPFPAALCERERILPSGNSGAMGGPYKMLRTQVLKRLDQLGANTLAILSAASGAGKTLTAINLAIAIAADPSRTALLVDLDLRNPNIHRRFGFEPAFGVEDCLMNRCRLHDAMVKIAGYERLTVLPARERVEDSSELLRSQRTLDLVLEMRARYANRILIFDLPPVLQADDALASSRLVQAGLVVVGEGRTKRDDVGRTIELLSELPIVGTVLNASRDTSQKFY